MVLWRWGTELVPGGVLIRLNINVLILQVVLNARYLIVEQVMARQKLLTNFRMIMNGD